MGIAAVLKRVDGQQVRNLPDPTGGVFDAAGDLDRVLPPGSEPFPLLNQFDPYGSVVFAGQQMNEHLAELDTIQQRALTPIEQHGLQRLRALAERCRGSDLQLWFLGD
ncbi:MAG: 2-haloacid dehalogenase [Acidimicrobiaceae bacterium]|nr:2-haloacid dehalogenase [Acidimicrobiaceae bacterium]